MRIPSEAISESAKSVGIELNDEEIDIIANEVEYRLRDVLQDASTYMVFSRRDKLSVNDINNALKTKGLIPLFGYNSKSNLQFRKVDDCFYIRDEKIDLDDIIQEPLPNIEKPPVLESHWLVIDGIQPQIPQNPIKGEETAIKKSRLIEYQAESQVKIRSKHVLPVELQAFYNKVVNTIEGVIKKNNIMENNNIKIFDENVKNDSCRNNAECVLSSSGIQQLLPYFVQYFNEQLIKDFEHSYEYLMFYEDLIRNKEIFIDTYLHKIIPSIITTMISDKVQESCKNVCRNIILYINQNFSKKYVTLTGRIANTLANNLVNIDDELTRRYVVNTLFRLSENSKNILYKKIDEFDDELKAIIGEEAGNI